MNVYWILGFVFTVGFVFAAFGESYTLHVLAAVMLGFAFGGFIVAWLLGDDDDHELLRDTVRVYAALDNAAWMDVRDIAHEVSMSTGRVCEALDALIHFQLALDNPSNDKTLYRRF